MKRSMLPYFMVLLLLVLLGGRVQPQSTFQKTYSNGEYLSGTDIVFYNGCYYILGTCRINSYSTLLIEKTDLFGDSLLTRYYTATVPFEGKKIICSSGNLYVIANSFERNGNAQPLLAKIKDNGDVVWSKTFGTSGTENVNSAIMIDDSTIAVTGTINGSGAGQNDIVVSVIDTAGRLKWSKAYGTSGNEAGNAIRRISDTSFVIVGSTDYFDPSGDMLVLKISLTGDFRWAKAFDMVDELNGNYLRSQSAIDIMETYTHYLAVCGPTLINLLVSPYWAWVPVVMKLTLDGSLIWSYSYEPYIGHQKEVFPSRLMETSDGSYLVLGTTCDLHAAIFKTTTGGYSNLCETFYPGVGFTCSANSICSTGESFVLTGRKNSQSDTALYLAKTNSNMQTGCYDEGMPNFFNATINTINPVTLSVNNITGIQDVPLFFQYNPSTLYVLCEIPTGTGIMEELPSIYPNPVKEYLYLDKISGSISYRLFNTKGDQVLTGVSKVVDFENINPGVYILEMETATGITRFKVVKIP